MGNPPREEFKINEKLLQKKSMADEVIDRTKTLDSPERSKSSGRKRLRGPPFSLVHPCSLSGLPSCPASSLSMSSSSGNGTRVLIKKREGNGLRSEERVHQENDGRRRWEQHHSQSLFITAAPAH